MPSPSADSSLTLEQLNDTSYNVDGDGPKTEPAEVRRTWYGKKKMELKDGTGTLKPVRQVKHRKYARLKKILNLGEKLKPLGLESSSNYDNQSQARDQPDEADSAVPKAEHIQQDNAQTEAINRNLQAAEDTRDLYIHVFEARDLRALDENGKSDPYAKIRVKKALQKTKVIEQDLNPVWDETFVFSTKSAESCLLSSQPRIFFELWDQDFLSPDEFLGQAHIDLSEVEIKTDSIEPLWLPLYGEKHGKEVQGLGEMRVAVWFSRSSAMEDQPTAGRVSEIKLSSLCNPPGIPKKLPIVIHTEGNCLYEEPCIRYLTLHIGQIRSMEQIKGAQQRPLHQRKPSAGKGSYLQLQPDEPDTSLFSDITKHSESMFLAEMRGATFWQGSDTESEVSDDSDDSSSEKEDRSKDEGEDPFNEEEENLENPLQTPNAEADSDAPSSQPVESKRLFFEASFGHQRRRTKIGRLQSKGFSWEQGLPFAATVPIKDKCFKLLLCEVDKQRQRSQLLAIAFIPLSELVKKSKASEGNWYQLHDYNERELGKPVPFGAVQLKLNGADSDVRRTLYNQPLIENRASKPIGRTLSTATSKASADYEQHLPQLPEENGHEAGDTNGLARGSKRRENWRSVRALELVRGWCDSFQQRSISLEGTTGLSRKLWQGAILMLILLQLILALVTTLASFCERGWQVFFAQLTGLFERIKHRQHKVQDSDEDVHPSYAKHKPSDRPLGLVKFLISNLTLKDQLEGAYFLVFKCGPHWGQSALQKSHEMLVYDWEVQLPIHDPYTLLVVTLFKSQHRRYTNKLTSKPPKMVGKLRLRINTLSPGLQYEADLPMLADRREGGAHTATMSLQAKLIYMDELPVLIQYFKAPQPGEIYDLGLAEGNVAKQLDFEYKRLTLQWLRTTEPSIPSGIAKEVIGLERQQFVFSRAKANWTRCALEKERFTWIMRFWQRNQKWENPAESVALMCGLVVFSFYPQVILVGLLLWIVTYALLTAPKRPGKPQEMYADPEDDDDEEETEEQGGIGQLRKKYMRLVKVALAVQNYLADAAEVLERLHSLITWADPRATLIFLFICILSALAIAILTLPVVMSIGLCWTVRPPFLRTPTPPPPAAFFLRLPTRSDQII